MAAKGKERYTQPSFPVQVVDPIGAGDAFAAGFLSSLLKSYDLKHALQIASAAGSLVVTVKGDQENIPSFEEAEEFLRGVEK
jgi:sugar/nucleoside kinase (ribokinase family)